MQKDSIQKELIISTIPQETRVAVLEDDELVEFIIERHRAQNIAGNIYKGRVMKVLPGMQSAFVNIGLDRDAFLYVSDFFDDTDEYERIVASAENEAHGGPDRARASKSARGEGRRSGRGEARSDTRGAPRSDTREAKSDTREARSDTQEPRGERREPRSDTREARSDTQEPRGERPEPRSDTRAESRSQERVDRDERSRNNRNRKERVDREAERRPSAETRTERSESETSEKPSDRRGPRRRGEQRERKGRIRSFEPANDPQTNSRSLELLPGESLARYAEGPEDPVQTDVDDELALVIDETQEPPILDTSPSEASASVDDADEGETAEEETFDSLADAVLGPDEDAPIEQSAPDPEEPADDAAAPDDSIADGDSGYEDSEDSFVANESDGDGPSDDEDSSSFGQVRILDDPNKFRFSRRSPVRRSRRRSPRDSSGEQASSGGPMISELLREGQEILVQVSKEPLGKKGARITSHIALPGRYIVYMPTVDHIGVSRKIASEEERSRLRRIIADNRDDLPGGFVVRTAGEGHDEREFIQDIRFLGNLWAEIREKSDNGGAPALIHSDLNLVQRVLRDQLSDEFKAIRLDSESEYAKVLEFVNRFQPALVNRVRLHLKDNSIFEEHGLQQEIDKAMKPKVWLKSGGYIVVNQTEALVAIDVNTGKFVGKSNRLEDTIVRTNMDAAHEIVRQIRLRNLGGIIVVDFIDMEERKSRQRVMQTLEQEIRKDRSPSKILQFNDFGLVAITRKRTQPSLERVLGRSCPRCTGSGIIKAVETVCYEVQQELRKMMTEVDGKEITIRVGDEVAKALKSGEFVDLSDLEEEAKKDIRIQSDSTLEAERFDIF